MSLRQLAAVGGVALMAGCSQPTPVLQNLTPDSLVISIVDPGFTRALPQVAWASLGSDFYQKWNDEAGRFLLAAVRKSDGAPVASLNPKASKSLIWTFPDTRDLQIYFNTSFILRTVEILNMRLNEAKVSYRVNTSEFRLMVSIFYEQYNNTFGVYRYGPFGHDYDIDLQNPLPLNLSSIEMGPWGGKSPLAV